MDIPFLVVAVAAGLLLPRNRALLVTAGAWIFAVLFVGWGPAKSDGVHTDSLGFWLPWAIVLLIALGLTTLMAYLRSRRRDAAV